MPIRIKKDGRGVRFDVYYEDEEKIVDFEMQNRKREGFDKRIRYYQSMLDGELLKRKEDYVHLKDTFIVFICLYDPFGKGRIRYTFRHTCLEGPSLELDTGANVIILCADPEVLRRHGDDGSELCRFLCYIAGIKDVPGTELTPMIHNAVEEEITDEEGRKRYMSLKEMLDDERQEGKLEGKLEGKVEGKAEGKAETLHETGRRLIAMGSDDEFIARATGMSLREVQQLRINNK